MMAVPRYPRVRQAGRVRRFVRFVRRAWLTHQIVGAHFEIRSIQNMIDNDVTVIHECPDMAPKLTPIIDQWFYDRQDAERKLTRLKLQLLNLDRLQ